jgi:hypothetical protein
VPKGLIRIYGHGDSNFITCPGSPARAVFAGWGGLYLLSPVTIPGVGAPP